MLSIITKWYGKRKYISAQRASNTRPRSLHIYIYIYNYTPNTLTRIDSRCAAAATLRIRRIFVTWPPRDEDVRRTDSLYIFFADLSLRLGSIIHAIVFSPLPVFFFSLLARLAFLLKTSAGSRIHTHMYTTTKCKLHWLVIIFLFSRCCRAACFFFHRLSEICALDDISKITRRQNARFSNGFQRVCHKSIMATRDDSGEWLPVIIYYE